MVDRLLERALEKPWSRADFREERRALGRLAAAYLNASRAEAGWSPIPIETVWAWDEATRDSTASQGATHEGAKKGIHVRSVTERVRTQAP